MTGIGEVSVATVAKNDVVAIIGGNKVITKPADQNVIAVACGKSVIGASIMEDRYSIEWQ